MVTDECGENGTRLIGGGGRLPRSRLQLSYFHSPAGNSTLKLSSRCSHLNPYQRMHHHWLLPQLHCRHGGGRSLLKSAPLCRVCRSGSTVSNHPSQQLSPPSSNLSFTPAALTLISTHFTRLCSHPHPAPPTYSSAAPQFCAVLPPDAASPFYRTGSRRSLTLPLVSPR